MVCLNIPLFTLRLKHQHGSERVTRHLVHKPNCSFLSSEPTYFEDFVTTLVFFCNLSLAVSTECAWFPLLPPLLSLCSGGAGFAG